MSDGKKNKGGRPKGSLSRLTYEVQDMLVRLDCNPIEGMAYIAMGNVPCPICHAVGVNMQGQRCSSCKGTGRDIVPTKLRAEMFKELATYVAPKRRAIEHTGLDGNDLFGGFAEAVKAAHDRDGHVE